MSHAKDFSTKLSENWTLAENILDDIMKVGFAIRHDQNFSTIKAVVSSLGIPSIFGELLVYEISDSWLPGKAKIYDVDGVVFYGFQDRDYLPICNSYGDVVKLFSPG